MVFQERRILFKDIAFFWLFDVTLNRLRSVFTEDLKKLKHHLQEFEVIFLAGRFAKPSFDRKRDCRFDRRHRIGDDEATKCRSSDNDHFSWLPNDVQMSAMR